MGVMHRVSDAASADLRVSLVPTVEGEKVVMRVLNTGAQGFSLSDIGLMDTHRELLEEYAAKPFGMILTVGPTGSGKTTTLYSLLKMLNRPKSNVTTIEDPVEYKLKGINQIQVNEATGLSFARGLRAIVRQDPDVILVGEIRDQETAEISVNAALTGHLLLSTFHANDAATAIPRLIDMGIEPFLLASTLEVIIAQRLARRICKKCRYSLSVTDASASVEPRLLKTIQKHFKKGETLYSGKGCSVCSGTGYSGRVALFEFIEITPAMKDLIASSPSTQSVVTLARREGAKSMFVDGIDKIRQGETTLEELFRVVAPPKELK
jgi:type II secretory ATPase GspE/PulE/Tfp pilus assembly ATPase PilB-like protein